MKHTRGPWSLFGLIDGSEHIGIHKKELHAIADVHRGVEKGMVSVEEAQANAQLIATAPELLKSLERLVEEARNPCSPSAINKDARFINGLNMYDEAEEIIAKAKGE